MLCVVSTIPTPSLCWNTKLLKQFFCFCWINCWSLPLALVLRDSFQDSFYKGGGWFSWTATTHPAFPSIPKVLVVDEVGQLVWPYDCNELGQPKLILAGSAHRSGSWGHDMLNGYADENPDESHFQLLRIRAWGHDILNGCADKMQMKVTLQLSGVRAWGHGMLNGCADNMQMKVTLQLAGVRTWGHDMLNGCTDKIQMKVTLQLWGVRAWPWGHDMLNGCADENPDESHSPAFRGQGLTLRSWHAEWLCRWKSGWKSLSSFQGSGLRPEVDKNF